MNLRKLLLILGLILMPLAAQAEGFYTTVCGTDTCPKTGYYLSVTNGAGITNVWLGLDVEPDAILIPGVNDHINSVAVQAANDLDVTQSDLYSGPSGFNFSTGLGSETPLSEAGCTSSGAGWVCSAVPDPGLPIQAGHTYEWTWHLVTDQPIFSQGNVQVNWGPAESYIFSSPISTPEPPSVLLLGIGLGILSAAWKVLR